MNTIMITGASGGIGLAVARVLAKDGNRLCLVARRKDKLAEIIKELSGSDHNYIAADLSTKEGINEVALELSNEHYNVLINNAGLGLFGIFADVEMEKYTHLLDLNILSVVRLSHAFLNMAKAGDALVNIGSVLGRTSLAGSSVYTGTKGFIVRFSESMWYEYRKRGIYVCAFSPGVTSSDFFSRTENDVESFPKFVQQSPDQVAIALRKALKRRSKPHVVPGFMNKMMLFWFRLIPRKQIVQIMAGFSPVKI